MGAGQSRSELSEGRGPCQQQLSLHSDQARRRIQLLEELCSHPGGAPGRQHALQQIAGGQADAETLHVAHVLASRPPEFCPGQLIAAGSYGRVYAGTYADQPAALKLLLLDEETAHAILNEVRLCLKLSHKNLVQLLDCAVVASNKHAAAAGFPALASPGAAFTGQHQILPLLGACSSSSPASPSVTAPFSYLPVVSGQEPFSSTSVTSPSAASKASCGSAEAAELPAASSGRLPSSLSAPLGHACFEVWIAMELCDGGTLAEQLQRGFHCSADTGQVDMEQLLEVGLDVARALAYMHRESVCHGDLKTENVLLKTLSAASAAEMRVCSSCGSSCCHEDCNWLTFFCNSSAASNSCGSRHCRSCSGDSCWSCATRTAGCLDTGGSSSPDTCSTSSSNASGPNAERRSRGGGSRGSLILSGLCCMGSPSSCATEDDVWDHEARATSGCFACGCGIMTLEPSTHSTTASCWPRPDTPTLPGHHQQLHAQQQQQPKPQAQPAVAPLGQETGECAATLMPPSSAELGLAAAPREPLALGSSADSVLPLFGAVSSWSQGLPPVIVEGQEQELPLLPPVGMYGLEQPCGVGSTVGVEDAPEEEHVAPLSLYTQARQRRRSRCLPPGALAAAAAAAAAAMNADSGHSSSGGGSSSSGSDDEGQPKDLSHARASGPRPARLLQRQCSLDDSILLSATAGHADGPTAGSGAGIKLHPGDSLAGPASGGGGAPTCHDVYALSMMCPPVARRARRHSYCYGTTAAYADAQVFNFHRSCGAEPPGRTQSFLSGVSATEAAVAIAAAAEAVRLDTTRAAGATERGSHRNRRMSWDDRLPVARSGLGGLLGNAWPGLTCLGSDGPAGLQPPPLPTAAGSRQGGGRRTRRHSWAGYLQPDMAAAAGSLGWGLHASSSVADRQHPQQQQQQGPFRLGGLGHSAYDGTYGATYASAASSGALGPIPSSSRAAPRARRHSWAGYAGYGAEQGTGKLSGLRALSSCFGPNSSGTHSVGGGQTSLLGGGLPRHLFNMPQFPGCCGESLSRPLDDPLDEADASARRSLLEGAAFSQLIDDGNTSNCLLISGADAEAAAAVGCFGRWCSSGTNSSMASSIGSGSQRKTRRRRSSWCCGAGSEAEVWADLTREESYSQLQLLSGAAPLSVPLLPVQPRERRSKLRRDRRCSFDECNFRSKPSLNARKAASLDVQASTPDSWRSSSQQLSTSPPQFAQSSSSVAGMQLAAAAAAASARAAAPRRGTQSEGLPVVPPLNDSSHAASTSSQQPAADLSDAASSPSQQPAADLMQLISPSLSCTSSPAVPQPGSRPAADASISAALQSPCVAGTRTNAQVGQSVINASGLSSTCMAAAKTSRVRISLEQLPLPSPAPGQQQQLPAAKQPGVSEGLLQAAQPWFAAGGSLAWEGAAAPCAAAAGQAVGVHQVTVQDLLTLCAPAQAAAAADGPAAAAEPAVGQQGCSELFMGSFPLHTAGGVQWDAAANGSKGTERRGRRWSTGVAAHQLLMRKQLLDEHGCDVLGEARTCVGGPAAASTVGVSTDAAGSAVACQEPVNMGGPWQLPGAAAAPDAPRPGTGSSAGNSANPLPGLSGGVVSANVSAGINVLGMPRQRPTVLSQRRISYDTSTGAYQIVAQMGSEQLKHALSPSQQPTQVQQPLLRQQHLAPSPAVEVCDLLPCPPASASTAAAPGTPQSLQPVVGSRLDSPQDAQLQHCQAQMQRLLDALAKKGYGGLLDAPTSASSSSHPTNTQDAVQQSPAALRAVATLQHQREVAQEVTHITQRRLCAKVCDFGFSKCLRAGQSHCSTTAAGTITHQAPEVLRHGHLSPAADVYAFGIILWELLTRDRPFKGLLEGDLVVGVCDRGLRPVFPPGCPASYVALAQQCWSDNPAQRPTAVQLVKRLNELLYEERRARLRTSASVSGAHLASAHAHCRRRRHSMPVAGVYGRQRRRSRRMSLFLLPFMRQPVVPEDAPLEEHSCDWRCSTASGQHTCPIHGSACAGSQARHSAEQHQRGAVHAGSPHRSRCSNLANSSGCHVVSGEGGSSSSNAVVSAGGLLASSSAFGCHKAALAAAPAGHSGSTAAAASGLVAGAGADGTEWFESF